ncbi:16101_t:CDS:2, partial [Acaulospora morrowiae]
MPSTIDVLDPYDISEDILTIKANRRNLSKILKQAKPSKEANQVSSADTFKTTAAKYYVRIGDKTVVATLDTGAAVRLEKGPWGRLGRDKTLLLGTDWFQKGKALIHFDEQKILLKYQGKELEVLISHNGLEKLVRPDEIEASDYESGDAFDKWEYESEEMEKKEGYYTEEQSKEEETTCEEIPSLAIYLAILEQVTMWKEEESTIEELKVDLDNLSEEKRVEVVKLFEAEEE